MLHVTGPQHGSRVPHGDRAAVPYVVVPYVAEMHYAYAAADFVICRCGAMTCAELGAVGLPAAYVPLPLRGGEQRLNAEPAVAAGGALLVDDADLDAGLGRGNPDPGAHRSRATRGDVGPGVGGRTPGADAVLARNVLAVIGRRRRFDLMRTPRPPGVALLAIP